ncbi:MAG: hypothetical protein AB1757_27650 [Acidobacteriota bacterium]
MMKHKFTATTLSVLLGFCLVVLSLPKAVAAKSGDDEPVIRLRANPGIAPLGKLYSLGAISINGKPTSGEQFIWGGELLQAFSQSANVRVEAVAELTLKRGAMVRLATSNTYQNESSRGVLVASLLTGDLNIRLEDGVSAYIQAGASIITASNGAAFKVTTREGRATAEASRGTVEIAQTTQPRFTVKPIGMGATNSVVARSTRQLQVQVTDENDKPVPDIPIIFALGATGSGTLGSGSSAGTTLTVRTDAQGMARAQFNAGDAGTSTDISATVEGTRYSWTGTFSAVKAAAGFWNPLTTTLVVAGAAVGVGLGVYYGTRDNNNDPIRQSGNPDVRP